MNRMLTLLAALAVVGFGCSQAAQDAPDNEEEKRQEEEKQDPQGNDRNNEEPVNELPRHSEWVEIQYANRVVAAFASYPKVVKPTLAVLLIHENQGLTDWMRELGDQIADEGYVAIAPDLLSGMAPGGGNTADFPNADAARAAISALPPQQVTDDLKAVADFIAKRPASGGKVMVAGFCWGGTETFRFVTNDADLVAACVFYGSSPTDPAAIARITAPVYGFYGGNDARINATVPQTEKLMQDAGKFYEPILYDGAGHAFMRQAAMTNNPDDPNKKAGVASWERLKGIFAKHNN